VGNDRVKGGRVYAWRGVDLGAAAEGVIGNGTSMGKLGGIGSNGAMEKHPPAHPEAERKQAVQTRKATDIQRKKKGNGTTRSQIEQD